MVALAMRHSHVPVPPSPITGKPAMDIESARRLRKNERGVTLLITAVGMVSVLAMAVLAMDVVSLYVAKDQAQATADAAALAGAQALANSGTTSAPSTVPLSTVCNGSTGQAGTGQADLWAQAVVAQSPVAGGLAGPPTTSCPIATNTNPRIQVTLTRTGLPTFFARISPLVVSRPTTVSPERRMPVTSHFWMMSTPRCDAARA